MTYSAIILSGGESSRFGEDKGLFTIYQKPLISLVLEKVEPITTEIILVTKRKHAAKYSSLFPSVQVCIDEYDSTAALVGVATGLLHATSKYSFVLPNDTPFLSIKILLLLQDLVEGYDAVIPQWPSGYLEPLHGIYCTKIASRAARASIQKGNFRLRHMIEHLGTVLFLSTLTLQQYDPELLTFYNINSPDDLNKISPIFKRQLITT